MAPHDVRNARPCPTTTVTHEAELQLVQEVLQRSPPALERFGGYLAAVPTIVAVHRRNSRISIPDQDIPDLVQDCLLLVWRKLPEFEGRASLPTWIYRLCSYELCNGFRRLARQRRLKQMAEVSSPEPTDRAGEPPQRVLLDLDLRLGLEHVNDQEREVLRLRHYEGCTFEEAASRLGWKVPQVKVHYYRGLRRLHDFLTARHWDGGPS
jgi:RNA polymerase sigma-70 factor (ECF subfamily)